MRLDLLLGSRVEQTIRNGSPSRRGEVLGQVTNLFIAASGQYSDEQIAIFDHVIARLAKDIEISARALLAARLAPISNAPPNVIRALALDDVIDVAGPVLSQSERLDESTLVEAASTKSQEHLLAIARRSSLLEVVTDVLVERGERHVLRSTAENRGARFSEYGFGQLVSRAEGDDELAASVGSRSDIPPRLFLILLEKASESVRIKLEATHPHPSEVRAAIAEITSRIRAQTLDASPDYAAARTNVEALHRSALLGERELAWFAREGCFEETTISLALMSKLPVEFIEGALLQGRSESIMILGRALDFTWGTVKAIMSMNSRLLSPQDLDQLRASFERLKPTTAQKVIRFYRVRTRTASEAGHA